MSEPGKPTVGSDISAESEEQPTSRHGFEYLDQPDGLGPWLVRLLKGVIVGIGAILPGLSGGVLAVIFKIYDHMIRFLANIRYRFIKQVLYFLPIGIGVGLGIILFAVVVDAAFGKFAAQFTCLFIGFVIGTFPSLYKTAGLRGHKTSDILIMVISAVGIGVLMIIGGNALVQVPPSVPVWFGSGALIGLGVIVPGMSPSNFLIYFGLYDKMAAGIKNFDFTVIIPLFFGLVLCVLLLAKLAAWAFDKYYGAMYHFILGMVIGSSVAIFPTVVFPAYTKENLAEIGLSMTGAIIFAVVMLILGVAASYAFSLLEDKVRRPASEVDKENAVVELESGFRKGTSQQKETSNKELLADKNQSTGGSSPNRSDRPGNVS